MRTSLHKRERTALNITNHSDFFVNLKNQSDENEDTHTNNNSSDNACTAQRMRERTFPIFDKRRAIRTACRGRQKHVEHSKRQSAVRTAGKGHAVHATERALLLDIKMRPRRLHLYAKADKKHPDCRYKREEIQAQRHRFLEKQMGKAAVSSQNRGSDTGLAAEPHRNQRTGDSGLFRAGGTRPRERLSAQAEQRTA